MSKRLKLEEVVRRFQEIHGDRYDYSLVQYVRAHGKIKIVCRKHGVFEQSSVNHRNGDNCPRCGIRSTEEVIVSFRAVHGERYDYSQVKYKNAITKVTIGCKEHGAFDQIPNSHTIYGSGCPKCGKAQNTGTSRGGFIKLAKGRPCTLYILECFNADERYYKIGLTSRSVKWRYRMSAQMPYHFRIVTEILGAAGGIYDLEKRAHSRLAHKSYRPSIYFGGCTECFTGITDQEAIEACY